MRERKGSAGTVLIVRMGRRRDRVELLEKIWEIRRNWGVGVDEDLIYGAEKDEVKTG